MLLFLWADERLPRAGNGTRTRDPNLGKVVLYQLSYSRIPRTGSILVPSAILGNGLRWAGAPPVLPSMEARGIEPLTS